MPLSPSDPGRALPRRRHVLLSLTRGALRVVIAGVVILWSVVLLGWLTLHWGILPHIDEWRGTIERHASAALGAPVRIGHIEVRSSGWVPALALRDVVLSDPQGREALRLPRVDAAIAPRSLLALQLRFAQLYIADAHLVVRRDAQGRWHVGGLDMADGVAMQGSAGADWVFAQREIVIEGGSLRWTDEWRGAPPLELRDVRLALRNGLLQHDLRLDATPPEALGDRFSLRGRFRQPLLARAGDWQRWAGTFYAELPRADAAAWRPHLSLPAALRGGVGAFRVWLDLANAQWRSATVDLALAGVNLQPDVQRPPWVLAQAQGRLTAERGADGMRLVAQGFSFRTTDGLDWPASNATLAWRQVVPAGGVPELLPPWQTLTGGELTADRLDLALLARLAERLPLDPSLQRPLVELAPQGRVTDVQASWSGSPTQPGRYRLRAKLDGLGIAALPSSEAGGVGRPGVRNARLTLEANETGGQAQLAIDNGALLLPGVFADPVLLLDRFSSRLVWHVRPLAATAKGPPEVELLLQDGRFANADAQGEMQLRWKTGAGNASTLGKGHRLPGQLELTGSLSKARAAAVARYLPLGLAASARDYVAAAVREGQVPRASFKVRGDLWDFPFAQGGEGEFHVAAQVEQLTLAYIPTTPAGPASRAAGAVSAPAVSWPPFTQVRGELIFDRGAMSIRNAEARLWDIALKDVNGAIPDLVHQPVLQIGGVGQGPLVDALRYMAATPLNGWTDHVLRDATATGRADLALSLSIPLDDTDRSTVRGEVDLNGNDLRLQPDVPLLQNAKGRISFTERGFSVTGGNAQALGGETLIEAGTQADGSVQVKVQGQASAEALRHATELGPLTRLAGAMSGRAPYQLQLGIHRGQTSFNLSSTLTGMAVDLPAPLHKTAAESLPLRVRTTLAPDGGATATRDSLRVELGSLVQAEFQRELGGAAPQVLRGAIGLGEPLPALPTSGVLAHAKFEQLDADAWRGALRRLQGDDATATALPGYVPDQLDLKAQALTLEGHTLTQLATTLQRRTAADGGVRWQASVQSDQAVGQVAWRAPLTPQGSPQLAVHLRRLVLGATATGTVAASATAHAKAGNDAGDLAASKALPELDIVVDELTWRGRPLGRLAVQAAGVAAGAREWRVSGLSLDAADAKLNGRGLWSAVPRRMTLDLTLDLADSGALLERLGMGAVMRGGQGRVTGQLAWQGSPFAPAWSHLTGTAKLGLDSGQFLKVEPGAARLLGLLSLQSLPRRLTLDFRDVFQQGFAFDNVSGDVSLADGVARTNNLRIRGLQAAVLLEGQADLKRETQDLHMVVVPEINAGTASLAYAAINPAVGLGTFLAQFLFRGTLQQAGTREFRIGGTWDQPSVAPIERVASAPRPDLDEPAAAPASAPATAASAADLVAR